MATKKAPHTRLKKLRKIIGYTQRKLAEKCGVSYPYLLAVETGQRRMSEKLARRISFATGAPKEWLLCAAGTSETPKDRFGREYSRAQFDQHLKWDASRNPGRDFGDVGDEMWMLSEEIFRLEAMARAAWRLGKFNIALLMIRDLAGTMEADLKLAAAFREELHQDIPGEMLDADLEGTLRYDSGLHWILDFLSPFARYRWSKAFEEGGTKESMFIQEISDLHQMVTDSFGLREDGKEAP